MPIPFGTSVNLCHWESVSIPEPIYHRKGNGNDSHTHYVGNLAHVCRELGCLSLWYRVSERGQREMENKLICEHCAEEAEELTAVSGTWACETCLENGEYARCEDCEEWRDTDHLYTVDEDRLVCRSCRHNYWTCIDCDGVFSDDYGWTTIGGDTYCDSCRDNSFVWCDECEEWEESTCSRSCDCEPQGTAFTVRNGDDRLPNDTPVRISLGGKEISQSGLEEVRRTLRIYASLLSERESLKSVGADYTEYYAIGNLGWDLCLIGTEYQTREGNYSKRVGKLAHKRGVRLPADVLSKIGQIARENSAEISFDVEVTRALNESAGYFYHEDSCWWQSYSFSRCTLKTNGGFGIRSLDPDDGDVTGRAWAMPLKMTDGDLRPTFDTEEPYAFLVFNGYGSLADRNAARILAKMHGWEYVQTGFNPPSDSVMYVNGGSAYLVAPKDVTDEIANLRMPCHLDCHSDLFATESRSGALVGAA